MRATCRCQLVCAFLLVAWPAFGWNADHAVRRIEETQGFRSDNLFHFTISPDDRWLVFFRRTTPEEAATRHWSLGNLRVLDLRSGSLHSFTLAEGEAPESLEHGDASWSPDSSHCLLPPPTSFTWDGENGILIDVHDPAKISVVSTAVGHGPQRGVDVKGTPYSTLEQYRCSDCSRHLNDVELMKKRVEEKYLDFEPAPIYANAYAKQIVSFDGKKIYFQKGARTDEVALIELDIASGQERELASYKGDCAQIDRMRPSPDGKKLAFQFTTGCNFVSKPTVCVMDVATGVYQTIGKASGGTMHWTSDSRRLFFYRENYLHVAEFGKPPADNAPESKGAPATTTPATQPADHTN
jgi:hypothetical protein